ncbi:formyltransferase family protein [Thermodesulfobacteriota bacterium]
MVDDLERKRIVVLTGQDIYHDATSSILIESGLNVVGICRASSKTYGLPINMMTRWIKRGYFFRTIGQIVGRVLYIMLRGNEDKRILGELYNVENINRLLRTWGGPILDVKSYSEKETFKILKSWKPDVIVVHSYEWVDKKIRELPKDSLVVGGHPGITPQYRGAHSAFWAIYNSDFKNVGWTVFHLDAGVDTGDIIQQGRLKVGEDDSYFTLGWKGMIEIAKCQASALLVWEKTGSITRNKHVEIPENSEYPVPPLFAHLKYWRNLREFRQ